MNLPRALVLNISYQPVHICPARRALVLVISGVAESVADRDLRLRSPSAEFVVPAVIRLHQFLQPRWQPMVRLSRKGILIRDTHTCQYCGRRASDLTVDHVLPRSRGGRTAWTNLVTCCDQCNARKGNRTPAEAGMRLIRRPGRPPLYGYALDPLWEPYIAFWKT